MSQKKDPLGRPFGSSIFDTNKRLMLTDDELTTIAHEARTRPAAEAARHLFPLIQHIAEAESRECCRCAFWVAYNQPDCVASQGECTYHGSPGAVLRLVAQEGVAAMLVPFDFACKAWQERALPSNDGQCSSA